jgi:TolB protein
LSKRFVLLFAVVFTLVLPALSQDWIRTGTGVGGEKIRMAVPDFKITSTDAAAAPLDKTFNEVLFNDLQQSGIFEMVSKSFYPLGAIGAPADVHLEAWSGAPAKTAMLAFGNLGVNAGKLQVQGWLFDVRSTASPQVLGKQYTDTATDESARMIAHRFADEIIFRLGGGINGIAETKIYFISSRTGHKEVWSMDYDGANQHQITHLGNIALSPRVSPDGSRIAFTSFLHSGAGLSMWSLWCASPPSAPQRSRPPGARTAPILRSPLRAPEILRSTSAIRTETTSSG